MDAKSKLETLTNAWYGYTLFSALVNIASAALGSGPFALVGIPVVLLVSVFSLFVAWAIGKLLLGHSSLTRSVVLVLSSIGLVFGALATFRFVGGRWTLQNVASALLTATGAWMQLRTVATLLDRRVKAYFAT